MEPLPTPECLWESILEGHGSIIVVVNKFFKYATFITTLVDCTTEETVGLFLKHVVEY